jgi:hypothetical protein
MRTGLRLIPRLPVVALLLALGACAAGNRYDYSNAIGGLPVSGKGNIAVDVIDARPYVVNGEKTADFVGIQRGGFGNPFDVRTASGGPLAGEMRTGIVNALQKQGFTVVPASDAAPRKLQLKVLEWKTDVMARMKVQYDLNLGVLDAQGKVLATSRTQGEEVLGGGFETANAGNAAKSFELRVTELMRDEVVRGALSAPGN